MLNPERILDLTSINEALRIPASQMKITKTLCGVRIQASSTKENPIVGVMVELLNVAPSITDEERKRHSELADGDTWRNWVEIPSRLYYGQMATLPDGVNR